MEGTTMKKRIIAIITILGLVFGLAACGSGGDDPLRIGIIQFAPHASLDNCHYGIVAGLAQGGYMDGENITITYQNAMGDRSQSDLMARNMVAAGYDMIIAIATPSAMSAFSATLEEDIPVIFSAISNPLAAGLVETLENPQSGATGTSDALNLEGQLTMIRAIMPEAERIGVLFTTGEVNSVNHLALFEELAPQFGFTVVSQGVTDASEVATGINALIAQGIDLLNNFTDNNVVNNIATVIRATDEAGIPVFGSESEQVALYGCVAAESIDYVALGIETGLMAAAVLSGEADIMTLPVTVFRESTPVFSSTNMARFGLTMPESFSHAIDLG